MGWVAGWVAGEAENKADSASIEVEVEAELGNIGEKMTILQLSKQVWLPYLQINRGLGGETRTEQFFGWLGSSFFCFQQLFKDEQQRYVFIGEYMKQVASYICISGLYGNYARLLFLVKSKVKGIIFRNSI